MGHKRTSTRDIALAAGVSQATVSNVLSGRSRLPIADATRERVLAAATEMRYRPNRLATGMFRGRTSMIGVVLPSVSSSFFSDMIRGIQHACMAEDCVTLVSYTQLDAAGEQREISRLLEHRVDGILVANCLSSWLDDLRTDGIPCVILEDRNHGGKVDVVASDDVDGAFQAVRHLVSLGHERIAFLAGDDEQTTFRDRRQGYEKALLECGISVATDLVLKCDRDIHCTPIGDWLRNKLAEPNRPTALFAVTDYHAEIAIRSLQGSGMSVPGDLSVVGYAGTEVARGLDLTTVEQYPYKIGRTAAERLFERMKIAGAPPMEILLPTSLIVRSSSAPVRLKDNGGK